MIVKRALERLFFVVESVVTALIYPFCLLRDRLAGQAGIPILMYHQIGRPVDGKRFCRDSVSPERFEAQMGALLEAGYEVVPLSGLVPGPQGLPREAPGRRAVLTFDDGYRDQVVNAYPILRRRRLPATFFLVAGSIGRPDPLPHLSLQDTDVREGGPASGWLPLAWEEIEMIAAGGIAIGSHGLSHRSLGTMSHEEAEVEARRSREILGERLGIPVDLFAYPFGSEAYGDFDVEIQAILSAAGYRAACTTVIGRNGGGADRLALRRIPMQERDGPFRVRCKLAGAYDWVGMMKALWQRLVPREERVEALAIDDAGGQGV
ncbi:MAG TPA: polysaccharide deacetylase family protein [Candidatus Polarisedimenticolia bacterium]|nr:polysaccharide deacetylase family protein [Candidatus Polarisedimenticolia bacterium]